MHTTLCLLLFSAAHDGVAATVNGETIPLAEVDRYAVVLRQNGPLTAAQSRSLREATVEMLIEEKLMQQYVSQNGPPSDTAAIDAAIAILKDKLAKDGSSLERYLRERGLSEAAFRNQLDVQDRFAKLVERKTTQAQYRAYHDANRAFFAGATVRVSHILLPVRANAADGEWAAAAQKLAELRKDIAGGQLTFAAAAKRFSVCPTAAVGGALGTLTRKDPRVDEAILKSAFALPLNAISEPVRSPEGVHLILVTATTAGRPTDYDKIAEQVKEEHAVDARQNLLPLLRAKAEIRITLP